MSEDTGRIMENVVYLEYLRRIIDHPERELFYWKDEQAGRDGKEIDFVVKNGNRIVEIVQVCTGDLSDDTKRRELRAIKKAAGKLRPERIMVITEEYEGIETYPYGTVEFIPAHHWLIDAQ